MTFFRPSTKKIIQAVGVLLKCERDHHMSYLRLLKLLYIADRESLRESCRPILGIRPVAMKYGPLHSAVYDLIKGEHIDEPAWSEHFQKDRYQIEMVEDPGVSELSRYEIRTLNATSEKFAAVDDMDIAEVTHTFPEWINHCSDPAANASETIPLEDIIDAVGRSADKEAILQEATEEAEIDRMFSEA